MTFKITSDDACTRLATVAATLETLSSFMEDAEFTEAVLKVRKAQELLREAVTICSHRGDTRGFRVKAIDRQRTKELIERLTSQNVTFDPLDSARIKSEIERMFALVRTEQEQVPGDRESRHNAVQKLLTAMWLYPGYKLESRGPVGCLIEAIRALEPETAAKVESGVDWEDLVDNKDD